MNGGDGAPHRGDGSVERAGAADDDVLARLAAEGESDVLAALDSDAAAARDDASAPPAAPLAQPVQAESRTNDDWTAQDAAQWPAWLREYFAAAEAGQAPTVNEDGSVSLPIAPDGTVGEGEVGREKADEEKAGEAGPSIPPDANAPSNASGAFGEAAVSEFSIPSTPRAPVTIPLPSGFDWADEDEGEDGGAQPLRAHPPSAERFAPTAAPSPEIPRAASPAPATATATTPNADADADVDVDVYVDAHDGGDAKVGVGVGSDVDAVPDSGRAEGENADENDGDDDEDLFDAVPAEDRERLLSSEASAGAAGGGFAPEAFGAETSPSGVDSVARQAAGEADGDTEAVSGGADGGASASVRAAAPIGAAADAVGVDTVAMSFSPAAVNTDSDTPPPSTSPSTSGARPVFYAAPDGATGAGSIDGIDESIESGESGGNGEDGKNRGEAGVGATAFAASSLPPADDDGFDPLSDLMEGADAGDFSDLMAKIGEAGSAGDIGHDADAGEQAAVDAALARAVDPNTSDFDAADGGIGGIGVDREDGVSADGDSGGGFGNDIDGNGPDGGVDGDNEYGDDKGDESNQRGAAVGGRAARRGRPAPAASGSGADSSRGGIVSIDGNMASDGQGKHGDEADSVANDAGDGIDPAASASSDADATDGADAAASAPALDVADLFAGMDDPAAFSFDDGMDEEMRALQAENYALDSTTDSAAGGADGADGGSGEAREGDGLNALARWKAIVLDWRGWPRQLRGVAARGALWAWEKIPEAWRERARSAWERLVEAVDWKANWSFYIDVFAALVGTISLGVIVATYLWG